MANNPSNAAPNQGQIQGKTTSICAVTYDFMEFIRVSEKLKKEKKSLQLI